MTLTDFEENVQKFLSTSASQSVDGTPSPALLVCQNPGCHLIWHQLANTTMFNLVEALRKIEKAGIATKGMQVLGVVRLYFTRSAQGYELQTTYWFVPTCAEHAQEILGDLIPEYMAQHPSLKNLKATGKRLPTAIDVRRLRTYGADVSDPKWQIDDPGGSDSSGDDTK